MKILIVGAGVIGSFNAARLTDAGQDVTLLARGRRLADLREHAVVLEDFRNGRRTTTRVPLADRLGPEDAYDLAIVIMRRNQIRSVLPMLAQNPRIPSVLFLGNNAAGPQDLIEALGRERVLVGLGNAGDRSPVPKCGDFRSGSEGRGCLLEDPRGRLTSSCRCSLPGRWRSSSARTHTGGPKAIRASLSRGASGAAGAAYSLETVSYASRGMDTEADSGISLSLVF